VRIYVLGEVAVETDGRLVRERDLPGRQARTVLAMLAVEVRHGATTEALADELWPERLPSSWETALRAIVSKLRRSVGPGARIDGATGSYRLCLPPAAWVDVDAAREALHDAETRLASADPSGAAASALVASLLARRPFLPGSYGPWTLRQRDRVSELRLRADECRAEALAATGDFVRSAQAAEQALALDPFRETLHRRLIRSHALAGDRAAAARAFLRCRDLLARELGIDPMPATVAAYRAAIAR